MIRTSLVWPCYLRQKQKLLFKSKSILEIRSMERGICPIAPLALHLTLYSLTGSRVCVWPLGSHDVISHVTNGTTHGPFLMVVCWRQVTLPHNCRDIEHQTFRVTTLTLSGHVTSSVTWPLERQLVVSYWSSIDTMSLSPTVAEILSVIIWITIFPLWTHWKPILGIFFGGGIGDYVIFSNLS